MDEHTSIIRITTFLRQEWIPLEQGSVSALLICGFKKTGKDTFARQLRDRAFTCYRGWLIYGARADVEHARAIFAKFVGAPLVSFASSLRARVYRLLELPEDFDYDRLKDAPREDGTTVRHHMIAVGSAGRACDSAFWAKETFNPIIAQCDVDGGDRFAICTDYRFANEETSCVAAGIDVCTARIFRSEVPIPARESDASSDSEHNLDNHPARFLIVRDSREFERAALLWPAYSRMVPICAFDNEHFAN